MSTIGKIIVGAIVAVICGVLVGTFAFQALKHDDSGEIKPLPPIEVTVP